MTATGGNSHSVETSPPLGGLGEAQPPADNVTNVVKRRHDSSSNYDGVRSSPKKIKVAVNCDVDDSDPADETPIEMVFEPGPENTLTIVDVDIKVLLKKLCSTECYALTTLEMTVVQNFSSLIVALTKVLQKNVVFREIFAKPPLKVDTRDKGWAHPWGKDAGATAMSSQGAGHHLCTTNFSSFDFQSLFTCKKTMDAHSVAHLWYQFFQTPRDMPQEVPCCFRDGVASIEKLENLPQGCLTIVGAPELVAAMALGMFVLPVPEWEAHCRSTLMHAYANSSFHKNQDRQLQAGYDLASLGENLSMDTLEQSDVVKACKDKFVLAKEPSRHEDIARHYQNLKSSEVAKFGNLKLVTTLLKIGSVFCDNAAARKACARLGARHGRSKHLLTMQPAKMLPFAQACADRWKPHLPEVINSLDFICMRDQFPAGIKGVTCIHLTGRAKQAKAERDLKDVGLIPMFLSRISIRISVLDRFQQQAHPKLKQIHKNIVTYEDTFPSHKQQAAMRLYAIPMADVAWIEMLDEGNVCLHKFLCDLAEGVFNDEIRQATIQTNSCYDAASLLEHIETITGKLTEIAKKFNNPANASSSEAAASSSILEQAFTAPPTDATAIVEDSMVVEDDDVAEQRRSQQLLFGKAATRRQEQQSFVQCSPSATTAQILAKLQAHPLVQCFKEQGKWNEKTALIWVDPGCGPQTKKPTREFPCRATLMGFLDARISAAYQLAHEHEAMVVATADGLRPGNRAFLNELIKAGKRACRAIPPALAPKKFDERLICGTFKDACTPYQQRRVGFANTPDFEITSLHSLSDFHTVKCRQRAEELGGRRTSSKLYECLTVTKPVDSIRCAYETKVKIWNGFEVETLQSLKSLGKRKSAWEGHQTLVYPSRGPEFLNCLMKDLKVTLLIVMVGGDANATTSALELVETEKVAVITVVNGPEHQSFCEKTIDDWILRARITPQHPLQNEVLGEEILSAFPGLASLALDEEEDEQEQDPDSDAIDNDSEDGEQCGDDDDPV